MASSATYFKRPADSTGGQALSRRQKFRRYIEKYNLLQFLFIVFICSYFLVPFEKLYKLTFYACIPLFFACISRADFRSVCRSWILRACAVWLGYLTLTLCWTPGVQLSDFDDIIRGSALVLLFFIIALYLAKADSRFLGRLFTALTLVSAVTAVISIVIFYSGSNSYVDRLVHFGVLNHPVSAAMCYGVAGLIALYGRESIIHFPGNHLRWPHYGAIFAIFAFVLLTASRGALLGLSCAVVIGSLLSRKWWVVPALIVAGLAILAIGSLAEVGPYDFLARGSSLRIEVWSIILARIEENLLFGSGIASDASVVLPDGTTINHAHQLFLGNHFYGGVPATISLLSMISIAAYVAYRKFRASGDVLCLTLLVYVVTIGLFDMGEFVRSPNLIWLYFWFPIVVIAAVEVSMDQEHQPTG